MTPDNGYRTLSPLFVLILTACSAAICLAQRSTDTKSNQSTPGARPSDYTLNRRTLPCLSRAQEKSLHNLSRQSSVPLFAEGWAHGGTIARLRLLVPSGATGGATLAQHAYKFVETNAALWKLNSMRQLRLRDLVASSECSSATFELMHPTGLPIFNAFLTVNLTPTGMITGVNARLTGEGLRATDVKGRMAASEARRILYTAVRKPNIALPEQTEVILDPFFISDGAHDATRGWMFSTERVSHTRRPFINVGSMLRGGLGITLPERVTVGPYIVDQLRGRVIREGITFQPIATEPSTCFGSHSPRPQVVLDPLTGTPASVEMAHMGGVATSGTTPVERAYDLLASELIARMYGDAAPREHLRNPVAVPGVNGRLHVKFKEYYSGIPVEGAHLIVTINAEGRGETILGRFVYFPAVKTTIPDVPEQEARRKAFDKYLELECKGDSACIASRQQSPVELTRAGYRVVLSSKIFEGTQIPPASERLAWKFEFPGRIIYWQATAPDQFLYDLPTILSFPSRVHNFAENDRVEFEDGTAVQGITPHPDAAAANGFIPVIDRFYLGKLERDSFDGLGSRLVVHVRDETDSNAYWDRDKREMFVGTDVQADDVVAHEFAHGVTQFTANLAYKAEPGALNESYSDVMASLIFPDSDPSNWLLGETSQCGAIRDMKDPGRDLGFSFKCGIPAGKQPSHAAMKSDACMPLDGCVHFWSGIPNRAAVLVADGGIPGTPRPGIGRAKLAKLYFETLKSGLGESSRFLNQRVATVARCRELVGTVTEGSAWTHDDCYHVGKSFDAVGIIANPLDGYDMFDGGLLLVDYKRPKFTGERLFRGCTVKDLTLLGDDLRTGEHREDTKCTGCDNPTIDFGEWGAQVTERGAVNDPADRSVVYRVRSKWILQRGIIDVRDSYNKPSGITDMQCELPAPNTHTRELYSVERIDRAGPWWDGGDVVINSGKRMPADCKVANVLGVEYHVVTDVDLFGGITTRIELADGTFKPSDNHITHGFTVSREGVDDNDLSVKLNWWHINGGRIIVRVYYKIHEPDNVDCSVEGATQTGN